MVVLGIFVVALRCHSKLWVSDCISTDFFRQPLFPKRHLVPESAGDFYDATEMDGMLTLGVMTPADHEKDEMRLAEDGVRNLLLFLFSRGRRAGRLEWPRFRMKGSILVPGLGSIFRGGEACGVEVFNGLRQHPLPDYAIVSDFGIRSYDLACALREERDLVILVDALSDGGESGTLYTIEPERSADCSPWLV
jgi:hypothetical protein